MSDSSSNETEHIVKNFFKRNPSLLWFCHTSIFFSFDALMQTRRCKQERFGERRDCSIKTELECEKI